MSKRCNHNLACSQCKEYHEQTIRSMVALSDQLIRAVKERNHSLTELNNTVRNCKDNHVDEYLKKN